MRPSPPTKVDVLTPADAPQAPPGEPAADVAPGITGAVPAPSAPVAAPEIEE
jgi:hypothetical protein